MRIRLFEADRERFGCGEWLDFHIGRITNREAATLQRAFGYDDHVAVAEAFNAQWARDEHGDLDVAKSRTDYDAWDAVVWLALRHAGALTAHTRADMAAELADLVYTVTAVRVAPDQFVDEAETGTGDEAGPAGDAEPGKGDPPQSGTSTR